VAACIPRRAAGGKPNSGWTFSAIDMVKHRRDRVAAKNVAISEEPLQAPLPRRQRRDAANVRHTGTRCNYSALAL